MASVTSRLNFEGMLTVTIPYAFHKDEDGNVVRDVIDKTVRRLPKMYAFLDAAVAPGYLGGDSFTMADCFLAPILASAQRFPEAQENMANSQNLQSYFATMSERDSFKNTAG